MNDLHIEALVQAALCLNAGEKEQAKYLIQERYPFIPVAANKRKYSVKEMINQFFQDGFIDRYSGQRLINPGMLRVMSEELNDIFPYHPHWKTDACHIAYWEWQPTIDHIIPVSLGGIDDSSNWVTTSMMNNLAKGNFTLEQLGWTLKEKGDVRQWDGLTKVFVQAAERDVALLDIPRINAYYRATKAMLKAVKEW